MKKLSKLAAIIASLALLFGAVACSDDDSDDSPAKTDVSGPNGGNGGNTSTFQSKTAELTFAAAGIEDDDISYITDQTVKIVDTTIATLTIDKTNKKFVVTSHKAGKTTVQVLAEDGVTFEDFYEITVDEDGTVTITEVEENDPNPPASTKTTYTYTHGGENADVWVASTTATTKITVDGSDVVALKIGKAENADSDTLVLTASGKSAKISMTGFTTSSSNASDYCTVELLDAANNVLATGKGTTPENKAQGSYTFTPATLTSTNDFAKIRFTCNTEKKGYGILTISVEVE